MDRRQFLTIATATGLAPGLARAQEPAQKIVATPAGLVGELHLPAGPGRAPGLLILGGSEGGHGPAYHFAQVFAARGFASLGLAYFGDPGVPATLENLPLEYFTRAIDWLCAQPGVDPKRIGIFGGSKGGEAALLVAARDSRIKAVVAGVPSSVAWQGYNPANLANPGPSWTEGGKPIPYAPYDRSAPFRGLLDLYQRSLAKAPPEAVIPVERINGPVLLVSARDDQIWPCAAMGDAVIARLDKAKFRYAHTNLAYANAGHAGFGEPLAPGTVVPPAILAQAGGTSEGNLAMRADAWPKMLAFLDQTLRPARKGT
jgi:dienelactone hydrolase